MITYWGPEGCHQLGEGGYEGVTTREVLARMAEAARVEPGAELAWYLGICPSFLADAERRNILPVAWIRSLVLDTNANPVWLMTGQGGKYW